MFVRFEWLILEGAVLAWAVWQLVSVRRSIRKDREAAAARAAAAGAPPEAGGSGAAGAVSPPRPG